MSEQDELREFLSDGTEEVFKLPDGAPKELTHEDILNTEEEAELVEAMYIGRKSNTYSIYGHDFLLQSLSVFGELQVGLLTKPYVGTDAYPRASRTAVVAAALLEVDGQPLYGPLGKEDAGLVIRKRFEILTDPDKWYPLMVDAVFSKFNELEQEIRLLQEKLGKLNG